MPAEETLALAPSAAASIWIESDLSFSLNEVVLIRVSITNQRVVVESLHEWSSNEGVKTSEFVYTCYMFSRHKIIDSLARRKP